MTHNFSTALKLKTAWVMYNGFLWNFEDTEFVVVDGKSTRWWMSLTNRFSNALTARLRSPAIVRSPRHGCKHAMATAILIPLRSGV